MGSDREKIVSLIAEIQDHGKNFDPDRISHLSEVHFDSPNIDLVNDLIERYRSGNIIGQSKKSNPRPLDCILRELREEFSNDG